MHEIKVDNEFVGNEIIQLLFQLVNKINSVENKDFEIVFSFEITVKKIDILLIGYLVLLKKQNHGFSFTFTGLTQYLEPYNTLRQYKFFGSLALGAELFKIKYKSDKYPNQNFEDRNDYTESEIFSHSFAPLFMISEDLVKFNFYFKSNINEIDPLKIEQKNLTRNDFLNNNQNFEIQVIKNNRKNYQIYKIKRYDDVLKDLMYLYYSDLKKLIRNDEKIKKTESTPKSQVKSILGKIELEKLNVFEIVLFNITAHRLTNNLQIDLNLSLKLLKNYEFVKDVSRGIKEIAKNTLEHTEDKMGIVTLRAFKEDDWTQLKKDYFPLENENIESYLGTYNEFIKEIKVNSFVDINTIDLGKKGIIENFLIDSEEKAKTFEDIKLKEIFRADIKKIEEKEFKLTDFFVLGENIILNQQIKRLTAHLGLLHFSGLIKKHKGLIKVITKSFFNHNFESIAVFDKFSSSGSISINNHYGTCIQVTIPTVEDLLEDEIESEVKQPNIEKIIFLKSMMDMLESTVLDITHYDGGKNNMKNLFKYNLIHDNEFNNIEGIQNILPKNYTHTDLILDFENAKINESTLFRFLGYWEFYFKNINLHIVNLKNEVLINLIEINDFYSLMYPIVPYWNQDKFIWIYSYFCENNNEVKNELRFYFTDLLYGEQENLFVRINEIIAISNFNTISKLKKFEEENDEIKNSIDKHIKSLSIFKNGQISPFDLILIGKDKTLFEHSAEYLLQKIIPQNSILDE